MLTKQEREEIAERFRNYDKAEYVTLYSGMYDGLLGEHVPKETTVKKDRMELASRILELCDTSNMLELPVDKDGEVIHIGDTVYDDDNLEYKVKGYLTRRNNIEIILDAIKLTAYTTVLAEDLTHKKPVTIASINEQLRHVLADDDYDIGAGAYNQLSRIAEQLESLSDKDE